MSPGAVVTAVQVAAVVAALVAVAAAIVVWWRPTGARIVGLSVLASLLSLAVTAAQYPHGDGGALMGVWGLLETAGLLAGLAVLVRRSRPVIATAAGLLVGFAVAGALLRTIPPPLTAGTVLMCAFWSLLAAAAAAAGGHLRLQDVRRKRSVAEARRAQRTALAADLHDFVAHEVSGMLFQAQAANLVADHDPEQARAALRRIEAAGQRAMASLDRAVRMLRDVGGNGPQGIGDIRDLVDRYRADGPARVRLRIDADAEQGSHGEVSADVYRVIAEALTNVRRHAPDSDEIAVDIASADPPAVRIVVTNELPNHTTSPTAVPRTERVGGFGLATLRDRLAATGGSLRAGPYGPRGWRVTAVLQPAPHPRTDRTAE